LATYAPEVRAHRIHANWRLVALVALAAAVAGLAGYAIAGGFSSETNAGQDLSSRVMSVWASGDTAAINALYAPNAQLVGEYPGRPASEGDMNRAAVTETIKHAIAVGNTYTQVGPVTSYTAANGDMYVSSLIEVKGSGHPVGDPMVGFYRVHDGKIIRQIFLYAPGY
jgi:ketosteroid isomerase-like protein